jgi:hypothetical protein
MKPLHRSRAALAALCLLVLTSTLRADEGMWLFNNPPRKLLKDKYKFDPTDKWLEHVQKSAVRFNSGGSGSFVSADGLVMTNHHVGADAIQKLSSQEHNYLRDGFHARTREEELPCKDEELNVLIGIEDVTARVNAAVKPDMTAADAARARRAVMADIENEALTRLKDPESKVYRCDVVTLFQGGQYHLYTYKKYTDVRLVFAPEQQIAFFGGDPDNFEYPRYDLDVCFFRVYEDKKPAKIEHYLKWSKAGATDNELVFVAGHPGRTNRLNTVADLEYLRDRQYPNILRLLYRWEVLLSSWSARDKENARRAKDELFSFQNSRKARDGGLAGLLDPAFFERKRAEEKQLRAAVLKDPKLKDAAAAWERIEQAQKVIAENAQTYNLLERGFGFHTEYFELARTLLRAAEEREKPNADRLREYRDSNLTSLKEGLLSKKPMYDDLEALKLADALTLLAETLGAESELVKKVLAGKSPRDRARELVQVTRVKDPSVREELYNGGKKALDASKDPMIELARLVDAEARAVRKVIEAQTEIKQQAYAQIVRARFALQGADTYPDATFTLRLAFGVVKGYEENGKKIPFETTYAGLYERAQQHDYRPPFDLPKRWLERKDKLDLKVPLNFVLTADIIGGNSGSPVINRDAEVVGLIFDGNIQSLVLDFYFTEVQARAVAVHSQGIIEALRKVYDARALADELTGRR